MSKAKKQSLPKNFEALLEQGNIPDLIAVFDHYDINAHDRYGKTALAFDACPDELARWLVAHGADLQAKDIWGNTPLHQRSRSFRGHIQILIELGADVHSTGNNGTPLHAASASHNLENTQLLLDHGANANCQNQNGLTPLELALQQCSNIDIVQMQAIAKLLLERGAKVSPQAQSFVQMIGKQFEFHRANFAKEHIAEVDEALSKLCALFQQTPVAQRQLHDGKSLITIPTASWQDQHESLWSLLVPSSGHCATIQGEVIRISGRIINEIKGNGAINWDKDYQKMGDAFIQHILSGHPLSDEEISEASQIVSDLKNAPDNCTRLAQFAVEWVIRNPNPAKLEKTAYKR